MRALQRWLHPSRPWGEYWGIKKHSFSIQQVRNKEANTTKLTSSLVLMEIV